MTRRRLIWLVPLAGFVLVAAGTSIVGGLASGAIEDEAERSAAARGVAVGGLVVGGVCAAWLALLWRRAVTEPLSQLRRAVERIGDGQLQSSAVRAGGYDFAPLAESLRDMADRLGERVRAITREANERQAVVASMAEGVMAVDGEARVITVNGAAARLLGVERDHVTGRSIYETVRNIDLQRCVERALESDGTVETEVTLRVGEAEHALQVHGTPLRDPDDARAHGAVIVFNDVTRLRQLEQVRQQFVANVSHELKTPISAIKAAVETLETDEMSQASADRFLPLITRQADRLHAIVEDLLMLARIEQDENAGQITLAPGPILPVLRGAVETCLASAGQRGIELEVEGDDALRATISSALLEQAIVNLLDNAIKFSPPRQAVQVRATRDNGEVVITVEDHGHGIEAEHLPRLFERFYRTDKARSRAVGGTGLGLSIVKHVAQSHGGKVSVDSAPGQGSTFRIHLPAA